jgi:hypothetical protein
VLTLLIYLAVVGQAPTRVLCLEDDGRVQIEGIVACMQAPVAATLADPVPHTIAQTSRACAAAPDACGPFCTDLPLMTDSIIAGNAAMIGMPASDHFLHPALPRPPRVTADLTTAATGYGVALAAAVGHALTLRQTVVLLC